jgi:hypothetical protein
MLAFYRVFLEALAASAQRFLECPHAIGTLSVGCLLLACLALCPRPTGETGEYSVCERFMSHLAIHFS